MYRCTNFRPRACPMYQCTNFFTAGLCAKAGFATVSKGIPLKVGLHCSNPVWYIAADAMCQIPCTNRTLMYRIIMPDPGQRSHPVWCFMFGGTAARCGPLRLPCATLHKRSPRLVCATTLHQQCPLCNVAQSRIDLPSRLYSSKSGIRDHPTGGSLIPCATSHTE